jgi:hypothetical protein
MPPSRCLLPVSARPTCSTTALSRRHACPSRAGAAPPYSPRHHGAISTPPPTTRCPRPPRHARPVPHPPAPLRAPVSARLSRSASTAQPYPPSTIPAPSYPPVSLSHTPVASRPHLATAPSPCTHCHIDMRIPRCISLPYASFCPGAALRWPPSHCALPTSRSVPPPVPRLRRPPHLHILRALTSAPVPASSTGVPPCSTPILPPPPASFRAATACHLPRLPPTMLRAAVPPLSSPRSSAYLPIHPSPAPSHRAPPRLCFIPRAPPALSPPSPPPRPRFPPTHIPYPPISLRYVVVPVLSFVTHLVHSNRTNFCLTIGVNPCDDSERMLQAHFFFHKPTLDLLGHQTLWIP